MIDIGFLVADDIALMHLGLAQEALRVANRVQGERLFNARIYCVRDEAVSANNGQVILPTHRMADTPLPAALFVIVSLRPEQVYDDSVAPLLKKIHRSDRLYGAIDSGAAFLARHGLIGQKTITVHWEYAPSFHELYPDVPLSHDGVVQQGRLLTCSGGLAVGQMMVSVVAQLHSTALAHRMAEILNYSRIDTEYFGPQHDNAKPLDMVERAIHVMQQHLNRPLSLDQIVEKLPISKRALMRKFEQQGKGSPMAYYRYLRLLQARALITESGLSVKRAAYACGFSSPAHLSNTYFEVFGERPSRLRVKN